MRVTQEADYAIRMCIVLDGLGRKAGADEIASLACITKKFALKILRKLCESEIVKSFKGAFGGYALAVDSGQLTIINIIEAIEGPLKISKCLECEHDCTKNPDKSRCKMHIAFGAINKNLIENLGKINIRMMNDESVSGADIADIINI